MKKYILTLSTTALGALFFSLPTLAMEPQEKKDEKTVSIIARTKVIETKRQYPKDIVELNLNNHWISNPMDLKFFECLTSLSLANCGLKNVEFAPNLFGLRYLDLQGNNLEKVDALGALPLFALNLGCNMELTTEAIAPIYGMHNTLTVLSLYDLYKVSPVGVSCLTNLFHLDIWRTRIDYTKGLGLGNLKKLQTFNCGMNMLSCSDSPSCPILSEIQNCPQLTSVNFSSCELEMKDFEVLAAACTDLKELTLLDITANSCYDENVEEARLIRRLIANGRTNLNVRVINDDPGEVNHYHSGEDIYCTFDDSCRKFGMY